MSLKHGRFHLPPHKYAQAWLRCNPVASVRSSLWERSSFQYPHWISISKSLHDHLTSAASRVIRSIRVLFQLSGYLRRHYWSNANAYRSFGASWSAPAWNDRCHLQSCDVHQPRQYFRFLCPARCARSILSYETPKIAAAPWAHCYKTRTSSYEGMGMQKYNREWNVLRFPAD
ncbi:hypothetical protein K474DRAFT_153343 [Panus rudis PR-1116 ss-1]|nr:hypothetical protein K474DRAFT_153343 [Panus rudis PR-1116 ss-1]